jgi:TRAP-type C4-dicarboxylate transport system permease small subunit
MTSKLYKALAVLAVVALPLVSSAQQTGQLSNLDRLVRAAGNILNIVIPIIITIALIVFFWGLVKYIANSGDEEARAVAVRRMVGGIVAFFVIVTLWGLVAFLQNALGINAQQGNNVNQIPTIDPYNPTPF